MSKTDEFVKNWGFTEGFEGPKDSREQLRADFRRTVESLLPAKSEINKRKNDRAAYIRELGYPMQVRVKYGDAIEETVEWLRSRLLAAIDAKDIPDKTENIKSFKTGCNAGKYGFLCSLQPGGLHCQTCDYCVDAKDDAKDLQDKK